MLKCPTGDSVLPQWNIILFTDERNKEIDWFIYRIVNNYLRVPPNVYAYIKYLHVSNIHTLLLTKTSSLTYNNIWLKEFADQKDLDLA